MWKLRQLGKSNLLRGAVKKAFNLYFRDGRIVKVRRGPLKGLSWKCSTSQQFWMPLGVYETETANWISSTLRQGDVFFDIGANFGYFTLAGRKSVGSEGKVFSFEPIPANCELVEGMVRLNGFENVKVIRAAVSDRMDKVEFTVEKNNANSHISSFGLPHATSNMLETVKVKTISLNEFCEMNDIYPDVIKCDVEGAEQAVLAGATKLLETGKTKWIISTHSKELGEKCREVMEAAGYGVATLKGFHHELLCVPN